jgi:hypothetical protein
MRKVRSTPHDSCACVHRGRGCACLDVRSRSVLEHGTATLQRAAHNVATVASPATRSTSCYMLHAKVVPPVPSPASYHGTCRPHATQPRCAASRHLEPRRNAPPRQTHLASHAASRSIRDHPAPLATITPSWQNTKRNMSCTPPPAPNLKQKVGTARKIRSVERGARIAGTIENQKAPLGGSIAPSICIRVWRSTTGKSGSCGKHVQSGRAEACETGAPTTGPKPRRCSEEMTCMGAVGFTQEGKQDDVRKG